MTELSEIVAAWPLAASMAAAIGVHGMYASRRRSSLNEALHELRRPLQALALASDAGEPASGLVASSVELATAAVERLDCELNGGGLETRRERVQMRPLLEAAVRRWMASATLHGGSLRLGWWAGDASVVGDPAALSQAFDNLIVNAIEHGGPAITVEARRLGGRLRVVVADSGRGPRPRLRGTAAAAFAARLLRRRRRGYGLAVVRRVAGTHGGCFALRRSERGTLAVMELALAEDRPKLAA